MKPAMYKPSIKISENLDAHPEYEQLVYVLRIFKL